MGKKSRELMRSRIERQITRQREEQRRDLMKKRIDIAKEGVKLYSHGRIVEGVKRYQHYLLVVEMWKKTTRDGLNPKLFDRRRDIYELILIAGIFWDMARLYDKAKRNDQKSELAFCLQKYVLFSKGFPYQTLTAEAVRRYLGSGKCKHRSEFRAAYSALTGEGCFIATAVVEHLDEETLPSLRAFRDQVLKKSVLGRTFIRIYYALSPRIAQGLEHCPSFIRKTVARSLDALVRTFLI